MSSPPLLRRRPGANSRGGRVGFAPGLLLPRRDPVAAITALLLSVVIVGLLVLAVMVVATHAILPPTGSSGLPSYALASEVPTDLALAIAIAFSAAIALNVIAAATRHFRLRDQ